ncbi:hypothetical protein V1264_016666 [Littorina saxatilis]|uniref:Reverse transcriptase domain-containing protein n=3 Tax=Littorina saxatilis TaxID=31220 RepID=A0AAN9GFU9_9CAEN
MDTKTLAKVKIKHQLFRKWRHTVQEAKSAELTYLRTKKKEDEEKYQQLEAQQEEAHARYTRARNQAKWACKQAIRQMEKQVAERAKDNPKVFWSYVKSRTTIRSGIADLKRKDGTLATSNVEKANTLNDFFQSVFTEETTGEMPEAPDYAFEKPLESVTVITSKVKTLLEKLNPNKALGPDGISPFILKQLADVLAYPISKIFTLSMDEGVLPEDWRTANVSPIFKKGSKQEPGNYRPVSLTCILCKVMEKLVRSSITQHLEENDLISREQHGFVKGRSCVTHLLEVLDDWTSAMEDGSCIDAIYMDFKKAFDTVPHGRLLSKLKAIGLQGKLLNWIQAFLSNRHQQVVVNGSHSAPAPVTSGIPQGSVLGPVLFVMYINDLPRVVNNSVKLFADDTKLYARSDSTELTNSIQDDLDRLQEWSETWLLSFHPQKCHTMKIGPKKSDAKYHMTNSADGVQHDLSETTLEKDLGVHIDDKLSFKEHITTSVSKANRVLGVIRRTFQNLDKETFVQLYKSLVRPILEYGHSVWNPQAKGLCKDLENVQRRATRMIGSLKELSYSERLRILGIPCLQHRRRRGDMIDTFKYLKGIYITQKPNLHKPPPTERDMRGNSLKLFKNFAKSKVRSAFFADRVVLDWNTLPENVVTADSVNCFKARLDSHWKDTSSVYTPSCY